MRIYGVTQIRTKLHFENTGKVSRKNKAYLNERYVPTCHTNAHVLYVITYTHCRRIIERLYFKMRTELGLYKTRGF
jgi:hypothetical protein